MMHRKCGRGTKQPCMKDNCCSKNFPKPYNKITKTNEDGFPEMRRRKPEEDGNSWINYKGECYTNEDVVPYNPYLLMKYQCHINVEVCSTIKAVKYLFKYVYKGSDRATVKIGAQKENVELEEEEIDEISSYQDCRYIGSYEAMWRTLNFPIQEQKPKVEQLDIHLKDNQTVYWKENKELQRNILDIQCISIHIQQGDL